MPSPDYKTLQSFRREGVRPRMNADKYAQIIEYLSQEPYTILEMYYRIGCAKNTIKRFFASLIKRKLVHVAEWHDQRQASPNRPLWAKAYVLGPGTDARRPPKFSQAERCRRWKERKKQLDFDRMIGLHGASANKDCEDEANP